MDGSPTSRATLDLCQTCGTTMPMGEPGPSALAGVRTCPDCLADLMLLARCRAPAALTASHRADVLRGQIHRRVKGEYPSLDSARQCVDPRDGTARVWMIDGGRWRLVAEVSAQAHAAQGPSDHTHP